MKKNAIALFILFFSIILVSCTTSKPDTAGATNNDSRAALIQQSTTATTNGESFPLKINQYVVDRVDFQTDPGFRLNWLDWVAENQLLVILHKYPVFTESDAEQKKAYLFNKKDKKRQLIFGGNLVGDSWSLQLKRMTDGNIGLQGVDKVIVFEKNTFRLIKEMQFPQGSSEVDVSLDGEQLVFINEEGLCVSDITASNPILLVKAEKKKSRPAIPKWSKNGKKIMYITNMAQGTNKVNIINPDGKGQRVFEFKENMFSGYWLPDDRHIVVSGGGEDFGVPATLKVIDTLEGKVIDFEKSGGIDLFGLPKDEQILFRQNSRKTGDLKSISFFS